MVSAIAAGLAAPSVSAETPPQQKQQVAGYFRMPLGTFEVTALYDGFVEIDSTRLGGASKKTRAFPNDTVLLTHLHPDHAGGLLTQAGDMAFSNAQIFVSRADAVYWLSEMNAARAPKDQQGLFEMSRAAVTPYIAAGQVHHTRSGSKNTGWRDQK